MNRSLIAVFIVVLVISLLFAPGKAMAVGIGVPFAGALIALLYKAFQRLGRTGGEKAREREASAHARRQRALLAVENKRAAEDLALMNAEADKNARQMERARILAEASRKDRKRACLQYVVEHLLVDCLIIDSNIWMDDEYGCFFYILEAACRGDRGYKIMFDAEQFDEICSISKSAEHGTGANQRTRSAIERIERFEGLGLLSIPRVTVDAKRVAGGAARIVRQLDAAAKDGKTIALVTGDRELRIKARKCLYKSSTAKFEIVNIESIIQECREVQAADQSSETVVSP